MPAAVPPAYLDHNATSPVRPEAAGMIRELHRIGVREVVMLTGDQPGVAHAVARQVGVDRVRAGLLPEDKLDAITAMQATVSAPISSGLEKGMSPWFSTIRPSNPASA